MFRNHILKLEKIFFYFFLFCLPFETRLILKKWGEEFNEWNSAFLYLTDLLIFAIFFFWALRLISEKKRPRPSIIKKNCLLFIILCLFFIISGLSLFGAKNLGLGIYQLIKLAEFLILFFYLKSNFRELFDLERVCQVLLSSAFFQAFVGICQFASQGSLGLKILGESPLGPNIEGVAKIVVFGVHPAAGGVKMIRAYGTFPHPNIFAAFLLFSLFCFYFLYLKVKETAFSTKLASMLIFTILVFSLFLTFSRTFIILFISFSIFLFLYLFFRKELYRPYHKRTTMLCTILLFAVVLCAIPMQKELCSRFVTGGVDAAINLRYFYNFISISIIRENPFLGTGLGNFVWRLQDFQGSLRAANLFYKLDVPETQVIPYQAPFWLFQPVHNIYLLIAAEIGIPGLLIFLVFLSLILWPAIKLARENNLFSIFYFLFSIFLIVFLTDHFFWTLQQGRLMFWVLCGILAGLEKKD